MVNLQSLISNLQNAIVDIPPVFSPGCTLSRDDIPNLPLASGSDAQMWLLDPDVAYAFPNDYGVTVLACFITKDKLPAFKADLGGSFERVFERLSLAPALGAAEPVSKIRGALDLPIIVRRAAQPGLALVGDAALASDPLWGTGCGNAFQSAEWLVEQTAAALGEGGDLDRALARYRREHRYQRTL